MLTKIISMLMIFLIQNTQNRESAALRLKVDEVLRPVRGAQNGSFINLEELTEEELVLIRSGMRKWRPGHERTPRSLGRYDARMKFKRVPSPRASELGNAVDRNDSR